MSSIKGLLIDIDGVIYNDTQPIPGSKETIAWLKEKGIPYRFITNTTMKSRDTLAAKLTSMGIETNKEQIFSAAYAASLYVRRRNGCCFMLLLDDAKKDYKDLECTSSKADYVVVGDMGKMFSYELLNKAFRYLHNGALLIALQKNRFWLSDEGYTLDAGAFVALLEYAADTEAVLIGKPARPFFETALSDLGLSPSEVMMVGDDVESDICGAAELGLKTCLVQTGKFRQNDLDKSSVKPDVLVKSIHSLIRLNIF